MFLALQIFPGRCQRAAGLPLFLVGAVLVHHRALERVAGGEADHVEVADHLGGGLRQRRHRLRDLELLAVLPHGLCDGGEFGSRHRGEEVVLGQSHSPGLIKG